MFFIWKFETTQNTECPASLRVHCRAELSYSARFFFHAVICNMFCENPWDYSFGYKKKKRERENVYMCKTESLC